MIFRRRVWTDKRLSLYHCPRNYAFTKDLSYASYYMHPRRGLYLHPSRRIPDAYSWDSMVWPYDDTQLAERTRLPPLVDLIIRRRNSLFGHVARLGKDTPAHQALRRQIDISRTSSWSLFNTSPGSPKMQVTESDCSYNDFPPADLWKCAISRGHSGVTYWRKRSRWLIRDDDD